MALPGRLHGEMRPDPNFHREYCERCGQSREWTIVNRGDKSSMKCNVCGNEVALKKPPISQIIEKVREKQVSTKKKATCPECLREFLIEYKPKTVQKIKCPYCLSEFDLAL